MSHYEQNDKMDTIERVYQSLWHLLIAGVGVYELKNQKGKLAKTLAVGLIAFHVDGAIADLTGSKPLSRRVLEGIVGGRDAEQEQVQAPRDYEYREPKKARR